MMRNVLLFSALVAGMALPALGQPAPTEPSAEPTTYWSAVAGFVETAPVIDGTLGAGEYNAIPMEITKAAMEAIGGTAPVLFTYDGTSYTDDADWSVTAYFSWDWNNFYMAFDFNDDVPVFPDNWGAQWNSTFLDKSALMFDFFDQAPAGNPFGVAGVWFLTAGRSDGVTSTVGYPINYGRGDWAGSAAFGSDGNWGAGSWPCAAAAKTGGYVVELAFTWASLEHSGYTITPAVNNRIGFAMETYDGDVDASTGRSFEVVAVTNSPTDWGYGAYNDPPNWGDIILSGTTLPGAAPPPPGTPVTGLLGLAILIGATGTAAVVTARRRS